MQTRFAPTSTLPTWLNFSDRIPAGSRRWLALPLLVGLLLLAPAPPGAGQTISDDQAMRILEQLDELEDQIRSGNRRARSTAIQRFREASASPRAATEFYLECVQALDFEANEARQSDFRAWRDRNQRRLSSDSHALALQLQLQYLVMSIRAAETDPTEMAPVIAELQQFMNNMVANQERIADQADMLRRPVTNTIFARAYGLDRSLRNENWEFSPMNYGGIFDKTLLPFYREFRPEQLGQAWNLRMRIEQVLAEESMDKAGYERFVRERIPEMQWDRAQDLFENEFRHQAITEMLAVVRNHPGHARAPGWIRTLRNQLVETFNTQPITPESGEITDSGGAPVTAPPVQVPLPGAGADNGGGLLGNDREMALPDPGAEAPANQPRPLLPD